MYIFIARFLRLGMVKQGALKSIVGQFSLIGAWPTWGGLVTSFNLSTLALTECWVY